MADSAPESAAVFRACVAHAVKQGGVLCADLVTAAQQALVREESSPVGAQRGSQARHLLERHRDALVRGFREALLQLCSPEESVPIVADNPSQPSLTDRIDVSLRVEMARVRQQAAHVAAPALTELDALISVAQGLEHVQPERNPLRPGNYVRALYGAVCALDVPMQVRRAWLGHMQRYLGPALFKEYQRIGSELRGQGIRAVHRAATSDSRQGRPPGSTTVSTLATHVARRSSPATRLDSPGPTEAFRGDFVPSGMTGHAYFSTEHAPVRAQGVASAFASSVHGPVADGGVSASGRLALPERTADDVLAQMMDTIAQDARLPPAVRHAALQLEPVLRRLVREDPRFFFDEWHPARRLLDALTARGMDHGATGTPDGTRFAQLIERSIEGLIHTEINGMEPFEQALRVLEQGMDAKPATPSSLAVISSASALGSDQPPPSVLSGEPAVVPRRDRRSTPGSTLEDAGPFSAGAPAVLNIGEWVRIATGHGTTRTQLTWCSPHQTLFLFTQADGNTRTMTRRMVIKSLANGSLIRDADGN